MTALSVPQGSLRSVLAMLPSQARVRVAPRGPLRAGSGLPKGSKKAPGLSLWPRSVMSVSVLSSIIASAHTVGVSGSRAPSPASRSVCRWALAQLAPSAAVVVGCARGIDACTRVRVPSARVVRASAFGAGPGALAARSSAVVRAVAGAGAAALWLSFPSGPCPAGLVPSPSSSACFAGYGSGSWASLALAVGRGVPALAFLPPGVSAPAGWGFAPVPHCSGPRDVWVRVRPAVVQSSLFASPSAL